MSDALLVQAGVAVQLTLVTDVREAMIIFCETVRSAPTRRESHGGHNQANSIKRRQGDSRAEPPPLD